MYFKKNKTILRTVISIVFVVLLIIPLFCLWANSPFIIPGHTVEWYSKEDLIQLCYENYDELNKVAESILDSKAFLEQIRGEDDGDEYIMFKSDSQFFAESEWENIVHVFKTIRPYSIDRSLRDGYDVVYISFALPSCDRTEEQHCLYYIKNPEAVLYYEANAWVGELEHINGYWYID